MYHYHNNEYVIEYHLLWYGITYRNDYNNYNGYYNSFSILLFCVIFFVLIRDRHVCKTSSKVTLHISCHFVVLQNVTWKLIDHCVD